MQRKQKEKLLKSGKEVQLSRAFRCIYKQCLLIKNYQFSLNYRRVKKVLKKIMKMHPKFQVQFFVALTVLSVVHSASLSKQTNESKELNVIKKIYDDCESKDDFTDCLKGKALTAISRAVEQVKLFLFSKV